MKREEISVYGRDEGKDYLRGRLRWQASDFDKWATHGSKDTKQGNDVIWRLKKGTTDSTNMHNMYTTKILVFE